MDFVDKSEIEKKGFIDLDVDKNADIVEEIKRMRKQKNAVILAHFYQEGEIQDIADFVGDSLGLSQQAAATQADIILFAGYISWLKLPRSWHRIKRC
jgi:quinolinate synthase